MQEKDWGKEKNRGEGKGRECFWEKNETMWGLDFTNSLLTITD